MSGKKTKRDEIHKTVSNSFTPLALEGPEKILVLETKTGELKEVADVIPDDKARYIQRQNNWAGTRVYFYIGIQEREEELAKLLSPNACKMLMYLKAKIYLNNQVHKTIFEMGRELGMNETTAYTAFKNLVKHTAVVNIKTRNNPVWFVDPSLCFKGQFSKQKKMLDSYVEALKGKE